ncbi:hypothetical protein PCH_Pc12g07730 [Penicillium rubens Wisconsin 54-1255]|uniref:Secreted protein n=1 Tax=Penicillium rubens (strain ATCC 28089 / DSM 1075 / NRRL 1951 / Wisconsin 54-1255) TaxID=500485 RepID=B6GXC6_PENRW|nr:hypothetical protein PCH_Pc12g07730 [Penicillium rubens Wisconsin 54-1255]
MGFLVDVCICLELLAHIHYMVLFWDSPGLPIEPDLLHSAGVLLRGLIRDLLAAVTEHRRVWHMDTQGATHGEGAAVGGSLGTAALSRDFLSLRAPYTDRIYRVLHHPIRRYIGAYGL